jgi:hypothetical protein
VPLIVSSPSYIAIPSLVVTLFVQPPLVSDAAIPAADVGWHLFVEAPVTDVDAGYGAHAEAIAFIVPDVYGDEDSATTYPFRLQQLTGGIPVPKPICLVGSLSLRRVLHGSLSRTVRLTGSLTATRRLTGSIGPRIAGKKR